MTWIPENPRPAASKFCKKNVVGRDFGRLSRIDSSKSATSRVTRIESLPRQCRCSGRQGSGRMCKWSFPKANGINIKRMRFRYSRQLFSAWYTWFWLTYFGGDAVYGSKKLSCFYSMPFPALPEKLKDVTFAPKLSARSIIVYLNWPWARESWFAKHPVCFSAIAWRSEMIVR